MSVLPTQPLNPSSNSAPQQLRVARSVAGSILVEFGTSLNGYRVALSDQDAIRLCDALRRVIERPTRAMPAGKNVVVMAAEQERSAAK